MIPSKIRTIDELAAARDKLAETIDQLFDDAQAAIVYQGNPRDYAAGETETVEKMKASLADDLNTAEAQGVPVYDNANFIQNVITALGIKRFVASAT